MTRQIFYDLLLAAILAGVAVAVLSSMVGCQAPYRGAGDYKADKAFKTRAEVKTDARDKTIEALQDELGNLKAQVDAGNNRYTEGYWAGVKQTEEGYRKRPLDKDLEVTHLLVGEDPQKLWDESTRDFKGWCAKAGGGQLNCTEVPDKPKVKTIVIKDEVHVICLEFPMGPNEPNVRRCFDAESASGA